MPVLEVCERGYLIQLKEYERGTLQKGNGLDFGGGGGVGRRGTDKRPEHLLLFRCKSHICDVKVLPQYNNKIHREQRKTKQATIEITLINNPDTCKACLITDK